MKGKKLVVLGFVLFGFAGTALAGSVKGKVVLKGAPPKPGKIMMSADPKCLQQHPKGFLNEDVVVGKDGGLANVFVYIKEGVKGSFEAPKESKVVFDQKGCWYHPHVFGIQVNQKLEILNSDPTMHNVNAMAKKSPPFNSSMPPKIKPIEKKFTKPEVMVKIKCNVHPWMTAYAGVLDHPFYAVTDKTGGFEIKGVPSGSYTLVAWHEKYGTATDMKVTVADGKPLTVAFDFKTK